MQFRYKEVIAAFLLILFSLNADAANYVCGKDLNGDGYVDAQNETSSCVSTPQGWLCPVDAVECTPSCPPPYAPEGNFCVSQPECPQGGSYSPSSDLCEAQPSTSYICSVTGQSFPDQAGCTASCVETAQCTPASNPSLSGACSFSMLTRVWGNQNGMSFRKYPLGRCDIFTSGFQVGGNIQDPAGNPFTIFKIIANGSTLEFYSNGPLIGTLTISGAVAYGSISSTTYLVNLTGSGNVLSGVDANNQPAGQIVFSPVYECPLNRQQPCTGTPPSCSVTRPCTASYTCPDGYTLSGTSCTASPSCPSGGTLNTASDRCELSAPLSCPLDPSLPCMDDSGVKKCSPASCTDLDANPPVGDSADLSSYTNDGTVDQNTGECLGQLFIFNGKPGECRPAGAGTTFFDCCSNSQGGWFIFQKYCTEQEWQTNAARDAGRCHYIGRYCKTKWVGVGCVQSAKVYCCFNSKLGRIIHEQGRVQLKVFQPDGAWGSAKSPDCRGFTPEEFQMLDFSRIDLSEYFADIQTKAQGEIEQQMQQKIEQYYQNIRVR